MSPLVFYVCICHMGFPDGSDGKESACNAGGLGLIPGSGRSPGEENGNPLQYSCLGNPMDRGAWSATVQGVAESQTRLSMHACMQTSHQTPLRLGRHPGNFLARVQPTLKFLPQWILGRGNFRIHLLTSLPQVHVPIQLCWKPRWR